MAIEPQTGQRLAQVREQRPKLDYAQFMKALAATYPKAQQIRVVQDNLNTHDVSAFYEAFSAEEAFALARRFEFYYTPKQASWLNMIEIEFSALSTQCLARRIATKDQLEQEVLAIVHEREENAVKITWQFSIDKARKKLNRHYQQIHAENIRYEET
jgi:recombinational DNA repair ATPase RecF